MATAQLREDVGRRSHPTQVHPTTTEDWRGGPEHWQLRLRQTGLERMAKIPVLSVLRLWRTPSAQPSLPLCLSDPTRHPLKKPARGYMHSGGGGREGKKAPPMGHGWVSPLLQLPSCPDCGHAHTHSMYVSSCRVWDSNHTAVHTGPSYPTTVPQIGPSFERFSASVCSCLGDCPLPPLHTHGTP